MACDMQQAVGPTQRVLRRSLEDLDYLGGCRTSRQRWALAWRGWWVAGQRQSATGAARYKRVLNIWIKSIDGDASFIC